MYFWALMNFAYPDFLYALALLAIPIIIHLFNFRKYKVVRFSQVKFLKEVKQQTKSTSRLKHILVLISRCLVFTFLVLAFAKPVFIDKDKALDLGKKGVSIYIDNSFSMATNAEDGLLLDIAKNKALQILESYKETDKFQLISNEFNASDQRWYNKESFIDELQKIKLSPIFRSIEQVISRQTQISRSAELSPVYYLISDLQKNSFILGKPEIDSISINLIPIEADYKRNLSLDSLYLENPFHLAGGSEKLNYQVKNYIDEKAEDIPVKLFINNTLKSPSKVSIDEKALATGNVNFKSSDVKIQTGELIIKDYPITFDDTLFFNYPIHDQVSVLHIYEEEFNLGLESLFENDTFFTYQQNKVGQINYDALQTYQFIVLDELININTGLAQELSKFTSNGGSLFIIPNSEMNTESMNSFLAPINTDLYSKYNEGVVRLSELNLNSKIYQGVFNENPKNINLPQVNSYWSFKKQTQSIRESIIRLQNGNDFISHYQNEKGSIYLTSSSISEENSNFIKHAIFVPTFYKVALLSLNTNSLFSFIGAEKIKISIPENTESPIRLVNQSIDFIPKQRKQNKTISFDIGNELNQAGHYFIMLKQDTLGVLSLNYNRNESNLSTYTIDEVEDLAQENQILLSVFDADMESLSYEIAQQNEGINLWKYFLILALIFIGLEIFLLRLLK